MNSSTIKNLLSSYKLSPFLAIVVCALALLSWLILPTDAMLGFVAENGFIETSTIIIYFIAAFIIWLPKIITISSLQTRVAGTTILLSMAAREADLHKYISGISMFKLRFWTGDFPIEEKLLSVLIILVIATAVIYMFIKYYKAFFSALIKHKPAAVTLSTFLVVMITSKIIDRSLNAITEVVGWKAPRSLVALQNAFEEYLELLLPILVVVFIIQFYQRNHSISYAISELSDQERA